MENEWVITDEDISRDLYHLPCTSKLENRFFHMAGYCGSLKDRKETNINCFSCGKKPPNYIMMQLKLLGHK